MIETPDSQPALWQRLRTRMRTHERGVALFAGGVLSAFLAILLYNAIVPRPPQLTLSEVNLSVIQAMASATPPPPFSARVYQAIAPSLVFIEIEAEGADGDRGRGFGSGVVINERGDILTSLHVVVHAADIQLTFTDGSQSSAEVIGAQPENDIAVLRASTPPEMLLPATLGNPNAMRVGDEAFVVGHPLGLVGSLSAGVISGFDRSFEPVDGDFELDGLIQIDAAVNPGNSGGPLLNRHGHVIGIVTALANPTDQDVFIGIGFAVPINVAANAVGSPPY